MRDEFLSEEDLDLRDLDEAELLAWWDLWLRQAQATNDLDEHVYSHGVFRDATVASGQDHGDAPRSRRTDEGPRPDGTFGPAP